MVFIIISWLRYFPPTIIFYSKLGKETEDRTQAEQKLSDLATVSERGSDEYQAIEGASGRESVFGYLNQQHQDLMNYVGRDMELEELKKSFQDSLDVDPNTTLWSHLNKMDRQLREDKDTIAALNDRVQSLQIEKEDMSGKLQAAERERDESLQAAVDRQLDQIRKADSNYEQQVASAGWT